MTKEELKEKNRKYYEKNRDKVRSSHKCYYSENSETIKETRRKFREVNRDRISKARKLWYGDKGCSPEEVAKKRDYYLRNQEVIKGKRRLRTMKLYGLDAEEYQMLMEINEGRCDICGQTPTDTICLDHDHMTGKFRGLLCSGCNFLIGLAKDNVETLARATEYLNGPPCTEVLEEWRKFAGSGDQVRHQGEAASEIQESMVPKVQHDRK